MKRKIMSMKIARDLDLPTNILMEVLKLLPRDTCLVGSGQDLSWNVDLLWFKSEEFKEIDQHNCPPSFVVQVSNEGDVELLYENGEIMSSTTIQRLKALI